ncbi:mitochondrial import inner membrane translocase subunit-like [Raphidocelis subcapitata]|uniref:Mitochondrial import inner membrane translocase subunit TIM50 n=1 Tax=Raphidocelis subcapitata TaxID=307507 RepID=A0A2V0NYL3_9CHLO|nr:mitochondrial import inner membrane translocase subunit-like [Raphidocelis subcapitata]|eukprot:GBF92706.1 mitochondrial import inner membrane translocase subunit-like [Raphidocelis subcapitata]
MLRESVRRALGALAPLRGELAAAAEHAPAQHARAAAARHLPPRGGAAAAAAGRAPLRRWLSQEAGGGGGGKQAGKSMLDSGFAPGGGASPVLGTAAEMRMQQLQAEAAAAAAAAAAASGEAAAASAAPGGAARLRRVLGDALFYGSLLAAGGAGYVYYSYPTKDVEQWLGDARARAAEESPIWGVWAWVLDKYLDGAHFVDHKVREYTDPPCERLLPDLDPAYVGRVKTLVLDLEDVLVHREWSRAKGWQIYRRPGAREFLGQLGQYYEVVVYTDEQPLYADPIVNALDAGRTVQYRLYRQDTQYVDGKHVRDLSKLNRDLRHVLFVSANPDAYEFQPENTLKLKKWAPEKPGESKDTTLLDLIPFLVMVAERVPDVRDVVKAYDGEDDVARAFKERMAHIAHAPPRRKGGLLGGGGGGGGGAAAAVR